MKLFSVGLIVALCVLIGPRAARANDGYIDGVPGSPSVAKGEHPQIRMESERVILTLQNDGKYRTDARFVFVNDAAKSVTVRMGFPEGSSIESDEDLGLNTFLRFATTVDGRRVKARRTLVKNFGAASDVWWIKTVKFAPRERKNVRVEALSRVGAQGAYGGYIRQMAYNFTGANWKGWVARSDLEVRFPLRGLWAFSAETLQDENGKRYFWQPSFKRENGVAVLRKTWRDWQAQSDVIFSFHRVMPGWMEENPYGSHAGDEEFAKTVTFRVGPNRGIGTLDAGAPVGFVRDGVSFVAFHHLIVRADYASRRVETVSRWDANAGTATLQRRGLQLSWTPGSRVMIVRQNKAAPREVVLRAAPVTIDVAGSKTLYVPLAAAARELGLPLQVESEKRRFAIGK